MMKKITSLLIIVGALYMSACKNVTDITPTDALGSASIFSDSANIELAVVGLYHSVQSQIFGYNGGLDPRGYPFGAAHIEQGEMRGEDLVNVQGFFTIVYVNNETSASPNCVNLWAGLFEVVNVANTNIAGLTTTTAISKTRANAFIAECRFLRAMAVHDLLIFFARPYGDNPTTNLGVPYRDFPSQNDVDKAIAVPRATVSDCYTQIIADLDFAEANLPATRDAQLMVTRVTAGAAIALKTRVYQHMSDWGSVSTEAAKLVPSPAAPASPIGGYALAAQPDAAFTNNLSSESILSVEWSANEQGSPNGGLGSCFLPNASGGRGLIGVSPNLYNATFWTAGDTRRNSFLVQDAGGTNKYYVNKYKDPVTNTDYAPLIRYSEVILNYAEALARTTPLDPNAIALLNSVRSRAGNTDLTAGDFANGNALIQAILNERRIEFIGEGKRWPDIHRLSTDATFSPVAGGGIPTKLAFADYSPGDFSAASGNVIPGTAAAAIPYADHRFLYPISNVEIANNPNMAQNPGY